MVGATGGTLLGGYAADRIRAPTDLRRRASTTASAAWCWRSPSLTAADALVVGAAVPVRPGARGEPDAARHDGQGRRTARRRSARCSASSRAGLPLGAAITPVPFGFLIDRGHLNWCWWWWRPCCWRACSAPAPPARRLRARPEWRWPPNQRPDAHRLPSRRRRAALRRRVRWRHSRERPPRDRSPRERPRDDRRP